MADQDLSLGGNITTIEVISSTLNNIFDNVSANETVSGDTEYRCVYIKNKNSIDTMINTKIWIQTNTPNTNSTITIGLGSSTINGIEQAVNNENNSPSGVTFSTATNSANALLIGNIPAAQHKAIWIKRVINSSNNAYSNDNAIIRIQCES